MPLRACVPVIPYSVSDLVGRRVSLPDGTPAGVVLGAEPDPENPELAILEIDVDSPELGRMLVAGAALYGFSMDQLNSEVP